MSADGEAGADLPEERLIAVARAFFRAYGEGAYHRAEVFARYISQHSNGVIQPFGPEIYRFPHRTFQEYLAARRLVSSGGWDDDERLFWQRALRRADSGPQWREVLLLAVSQLAVVNQDISPAIELLHQLITRSTGVHVDRARDLALAGELLAEIGLPLLRQQSALAAGLWEQARHALTALIAGFDQPGASAIAPAARGRAGHALGLLGDPRFPVTHEAWQASLAQRGDTFTATGEHYWRYLPTGRYRIGWMLEHDIATFWVARLPITVAQFARFVAEGYREDGHWTAHGLKWRGDRTSPYRWNDPQYSGANQPVIGVTWYEATAFCDWLTRQLKLPSGYALRLPTEAEWEVAAAYDGSARPRTYSWGKEPPTPEQAVYDAWKLDAPAPVGLCPAGMAACGAMDLAGNVWELCSSHFEQYPEAAYTVQKDFTPGDFVVPRRGGSFWSGSTSVRCGARGWNPPDGWNNINGFRVVVAPPGG
ncbi:hypothetical protein OSCT_1780 [Oscillochloris trichoides DG-6]|uniref:Sulfatase-modifying factor enzyme-like domain-containing protein n=1 Tax=Oscillochloris trichoides DG-6 TaxID=765420 RepID=E1IEM9_9CHLR|nr:hypothetical protein OSCT_1780 [Oscillochloris trichoides DG-6]